MPTLKHEFRPLNQRAGYYLSSPRAPRSFSQGAPQPEPQIYPWLGLAASLKKIAATITTIMSIPSKPIPIPPRQPAADPNSGDEMSAQTEIYGAATRRMFERITSARLRAASNFYCKVVVAVDPSSQELVLMTQDDHLNAAAAATASSSQQEIGATTRRDRAYSLPELPPLPHPPSSLMDEVFPMDSL